MERGARSIGARTPLTRAMPRLFRHWWLVLAAGCAIYLPLFLPGNELIFDDHLLLTQNADLARWNYWREAMTHDYGVEFGEQAPRGYWRPLMMTLAIAGRNLFGAAPYGYHAVSLAAHLLTALLLGCAVMALMRREDCDQPDGVADSVALLAAMAFALHPLQTETVAFFTSLPDKLVVMFSLLLMLAMTARRTALAAAGATLAAMGALLSKESGALSIAAVVAAAVALNLKSENAARLRVIVAAACVVCAGVIFFIIRARVVSSASMMSTISLGMDESFCARSAWAVFLSAALTIVPQPSRYFWPLPDYLAAVRVTPAVAIMAWGALGAGGACVCVLAAWRGRVLAAHGLALTLASAAGAVLLAAVLPFGERYVYIAGPVLLLAAGMAALAAKRRVAFPEIKFADGRLDRASAVAWLFLSVCAAQTFLGSAHYSTRIGFWTHAQESAPQMGAPNWGLGYALFDLGQLDEAAIALKAGAELERTPQHRGLAELKLAETLLLLERPAEALEAAERAKTDLPGNPDPWFTEVLALHQAGRIDDSKNHLMSIRLMFNDIPDALSRADLLEQNLGLK